MSDLLFQRNRTNHAGRIARHDGSGGYIFRNDTTGANDCIFTDRNATKQCGTRTDGSTSFNQRRNALPISFRLQFSLLIGRAGETVIGKHDPMTYKDLVFQGHPFTDEGVTGDFTTVPDFCPFLNLDKGANLDIVADFTSVQIDEILQPDISAQFDVGGYPLEQIL
jgi:hypothetical protein